MNMSKSTRRLVTSSFILALFVSLTTLTRCSCGDDGKGNPVVPPATETIIAGHVLDQTDSAGIANANIVLYNANTNAPITRVLTGVNGGYLLHVDIGGTYYVKVTAQGYLPSPPAGGAPLPFQVALNDTTRNTIFSDPGRGRDRDREPLRNYRLDRQPGTGKRRPGGGHARGRFADRNQCLRTRRVLCNFQHVPRYLYAPQLSGRVPAGDWY
jgi:hypothetical protein